MQVSVTCAGPRATVGALGLLTAAYGWLGGGGRIWLTSEESGVVSADGDERAKRENPKENGCKRVAARETVRKLEEKQMF